MKLVSLMLVAATLSFGTSCAPTDWIGRTLVTEDVTGTWLATGGNLELTLDQQGAKVTGSARTIGAQYWGKLSGPIDASMAGDVFRFKLASGGEVRVEGDMIVSGDEMIGWVRSAIGGRAQVLLRRVNSARPSLPQQ